MDLKVQRVRFGDVRVAALERWRLGRLGRRGEPIECDWQSASQHLHHKCGAGCPTHVSLYCSFSDSADHLSDALADGRLDDLLLIGGGIGAWPPLDGEPDAALGRYYIRVLRTVDVILDDLQDLLKEAGSIGDLRSMLGAGAPLSLNSLRGFTNNVGKHGAKRTDRGLGLHLWNHHAEYLFADAPDASCAAASLTPLQVAPGLGAGPPFDSILFPALGEIVDVVKTALRNADTVINEPNVLEPLADRFGTCV